MAFQLSPGVNWTENDNNILVTGISTSAAGYVGAFSWGPVDQVLTLSDEPELARRLGRPTDVNFKSFFVSASYLAYTNHLKLVRVIGDNDRNAVSGGRGTGLKLDVNATEGVVSSVSVTSGQAGTNYTPGDVIRLASGVTPAFLRVARVTNGGAVAAIDLVSGGEGHNDGLAVNALSMTSALVKNDEDQENDIVLPELVARYPGENGNSLVFSAVRASEFDKWTFRNRFVVAPDADVISWDANGAQTAFTLPADVTALPADAVVTAHGIRIHEGVDPGNYSVTNGALVINKDTEVFTANGQTNVFNLANEYDLDTLNATVVSGATNLTRYVGVGPVPFGSFRSSVNKIEVGLNSKRFSGNGAAAVFTILGINSVSNARVFVNGSEKTVIATGTPTPGSVKVEASGANTLVTFSALEAPAIGSQNIEVLWGYPANNASVTVTFGAPAAGNGAVKAFYNQTEVHAVVVDVDGKFNGEKFSLLERYDFLSLDPSARAAEGGSNYYVNVINKRSAYVRLGSVIYSFEDKRLQGGSSSAVEATSSALIKGYAKFRNSEKVDVSHVIGGDASPEVANYLIGSITEYRRDSVSYFSPPFEACVNNTDNEVDDIIAHRRKLPSTSYATMDCAWKMVLDPYNDKFRWIPLAGDRAANYALTHEQFDSWLSADGPNRGRIRNCVQLSWIPDQTERDTLYKNGVNPVANFVDTGPIFYGDKTLLSKPSPFDRMNVRWLFITLALSIARSARFYLFQFNDEFTRNQFKNTVHPFLRDVMGRRGITDFRVVCDDRNNSGSVIDRNEFVGDIYIKPARSINFIQLNFNAVGTDVNFEEFINVNV